MSEPFLAEIRPTAFNFAPKGWALCNGQILPINQNQALFALLGTTYGGNGQTTFALPDLRGRVPISTGNGFTLGQRAGQENHTVTVSELPAHGHYLQGNSNAGNVNSPDGTLLARESAGVTMFLSDQPANSVMSPATVGNAGGSQPHPNMQPFLCVSFIIALQGIFPSPN